MIVLGLDGGCVVGSEVAGVLIGCQFYGRSGCGGWMGGWVVCLVDQVVRVWVGGWVVTFIECHVVGFGWVDELSVLRCVMS